MPGLPFGFDHFLLIVWLSIAVAFVAAVWRGVNALHGIAKAIRKLEPRPIVVLPPKPLPTEPPPRPRPVSTEIAEQYVRLAEGVRKALWKRRRMSWRLNHAVWVGLVSVAGAVYVYVDVVPMTFWVLFLPCYTVVAGLHVWELYQCSVSDQFNNAWVFYYEQEAYLSLGETQLSVPRKRPEGEESRKECKKEAPARRRYAWVIDALITVIILIMTLTVIRAKATTEPRHKGQDTVVSAGTMAPKKL